jgi:integrase
MGRRAKTPRAEWTGEFWRLRFTHEGVRHDFKNHTIKKSDLVRKNAWERERVAFVFSGAWKDQQSHGSDPGALLKEVASLYLAEVSGGEITARTAELYTDHLRTQFISRWTKLSDITRGALAAYQAERLKEVTYETVKKQLSTLRQVLKFAEARGWIGELPRFPPSPKKSKGTRARAGGRGFTEGFTAEHTAAILGKLHKVTKASREDGWAWPVYAFFKVLDETGLRPGLLEGMRYGTHWRSGQPYIAVSADIDKNRWARNVPLSPEALAALESVTPHPDGRMFRHLDFRFSLRKAATLGGVPAHIADRVHTYDLRHARTTDWVNKTGSLPGVGFLVGHKQATTTNRYSHADQKQGQEVIEMMTARKLLDSGDDSGGGRESAPGGSCDHLPEALSFALCEEEDSNLHGSYPTSTSRGGGLAESSDLRAKMDASGRQGSRLGPNIGERPHYFPARFELAAVAAGLGILPQEVA